MIHHLNCATFRPLGAFGGRLAPPRLVAHCLLLERADGLTLVDTGFGHDDIADPNRLGRPLLTMLRPALEPAETALAQVEALGHHADDVTDIVLTHLDLDHAGGLADFPGARVHVWGAELDAAQHPTRRERPRYIAAQWRHGPAWVRHEGAGDDWLGFEAVSVISDDVLLVPLHGHTRGHSGVAVRRPSGGWLLHAGDAYFDAREIDSPPAARPGIALYERLVAVDDRRRRDNQARLRELHKDRSAEVTLFSAHDPDEYAALAGR